MDEQSGFQAIGGGGRLLHGPRGLLACGLEPAEQEHLLGLADGLGGLPAVFATAAEAGRPLAELLALPAEHNRGAAPDLARAIVMSGLREIELHMLMAAWRKLGHERVLWATLTPVSESWPLARLLAELAAERARLEDGGDQADGS